MALLVNLRHLAVLEAVLHGELPAADLDLETGDIMIRVTQPLRYDVVVEKVNESLLVRGRLEIVLDCRCVRCLEPFPHALHLEGALCELPLQGEEAVPVANDCVDLTPYLREDILLQFPAHPACKPECPGIVIKSLSHLHTRDAAGSGERASSAWDELDKLKL